MFDFFYSFTVVLFLIMSAVLLIFLAGCLGLVILLGTCWFVGLAIWASMGLTGQLR